MEKNYLAHYGILGMKWGVRRFQNKDGTLTPAGKKRKVEDDIPKKKSKSEESSTSKAKQLTDDELKNQIARLRLEKDYNDLKKNEVKINKGKEFAMSVLEASGKNIATQLATYAMGAAVNVLVGSEIVNPKKGQKDK